MGPDYFDSLSLAQLRQRKSSKWQDVPEDVLPAWVAELDVPLAPTVQEALIRAIALGDTGYLPKRFPNLAEAFAQFATRRFDWSVLPEDVFTVPDVTAAIDQVIRLLTKPGDKVAMFVPAYPPFYETLLGSGKQIVELRLEYSEPARTGLHRNGARDTSTHPYERGWCVDFDAIARAFASGVKVMLLNNPHNPTGKVFTRSELLEVLNLACQHDVFVISDEVHAPLTLAGNRHVPWLAVDPEATRRGVVVTAATKAFNIAGLKCAVLVAEGSIHARVDQMPDEFKVMAGLLGAAASTAAFLHGDPWLDALLEHLSRNRAMVEHSLDPLRSRVRWMPPQATFLAWLDLRACGLGPDPANRILHHTRLALSKGTDFDPVCGRGWVRLNFGTTSAILQEILTRLGKALDSGMTDTTA